MSFAPFLVNLVALSNQEPQFLSIACWNIGCPASSAKVMVSRVQLRMMKGGFPIKRWITKRSSVTDYHKLQYLGYLLECSRYKTLYVFSAIEA
jgi:hypothetical protein